MQANVTTAPTAPTQKPDAVGKLERVRAGLRAVIRDVQVSEGRLLDFDTAEDIMRTLHAAARELEALTVTVACMERKVR
jgi:hypothetical protein